MLKKWSNKLSSAASSGLATLSSSISDEQDHNSDAPTDLHENSHEEEKTSERTSSMASASSWLKKASSAATVMVKEGTTRAVELKNKAIEAADMDALQKRLGTALDSHVTEIDIDCLNLTYITPNIVAMGFPNESNAVSSRSSVMKYNPIEGVAFLLKDRHRGHYMIWNLSEEPYDYSKFDDQVLEFKFPGHPAPPLGLLFRICTSIESWIDADESNVAVVHCLTGKGRTGTVLACYLAWIGMFETPLEGLQFVSQKRNTTVEKITIPSQRRYIGYFTNMMDGVKPRSSPMLLRRVIMNTIPEFASRTLKDDSTGGEMTGCSPYLQIFKGGKLVFTTTMNDGSGGGNDGGGGGVSWVSSSEGSVSFPVECALQGDILIRCRHLTDSGQRISMFRAAFHTGYIPMGILRLTKAQLDGAVQDTRFKDDFFIDLIFAPIEATAEDDKGGNTPSDSGISVTGTDKVMFDDMLHRDESFWIDIAERKKRHASKKKMKLKAPASVTQSFSVLDHTDLEKKKESPQKTAVLKDEASKRKDSWGEDEEADLMAQLELIDTSPPSAAPVEQDLSSSSTSEKAASSSAGAADLSETQTLDDSTEPRNSNADGNDEEVPDLLTEEKLVPSPVSTSQPPPPPVVSIEDDIAELAKFEDELGLTPFSPSQVGKTGEVDSSLDFLNDDDFITSPKEATAKTESSNEIANIDLDNDNFDELEQYLEGLSK